MMDFETFKKMIELGVSTYKESYKKDKLLSEAFGGDTNVVTNLTFLDELTEIIKENMKDDEEWVDYLVFENLITDDYNENDLKIDIKGVKYPVTIEVIWNILTNNNM